MSNTEFRNAVPAMVMGVSSPEVMLQHGSLASLLALVASQESVYVDVDANDLPASSERPTALCGKGVSL